jgi:hypothetical protein
MWKISVAVATVLLSVGAVKPSVSSYTISTNLKKNDVTIFSPTLQVLPDRIANVAQRDERDGHASAEVTVKLKELPDSIIRLKIEVSGDYGSLSKVLDVKAEEWATITEGSLSLYLRVRKDRS